MKLKNLLVVLTSLLLSLAVLACAPVGGSGDDGGSVGDECEGKSDCADGLACLASTKQCVQTCESDDECGGDECIQITGGGYCSLESSNNSPANNNPANNNPANNNPANNNPANNNPANNNPANNNPAGLSCADAYECLVECQDQACQEGCFNSASPTAQGQLNNMLTCFEASCSDATTNDEFQACALANCDGELSICFEVGGTGGTGNATCDESYNCLVECGQDSACQTACFDDATAEAQGQLNDMFTCFQDFCADAATDQEFQDCAFANCEGEINACFGGGGGGATACLTDCVTDADCGNGEVCVDVTGQGNNQCVVEQGGQLGVPPNTPECDAQGNCAAGQTCFQVGG